MVCWIWILTNFDLQCCQFYASEKHSFFGDENFSNFFYVNFLIMFPLFCWIENVRETYLRLKPPPFAPKIKNAKKKQEKYAYCSNWKFNSELFLWLQKCWHHPPLPPPRRYFWLSSGKIALLVEMWIESWLDKYLLLDYLEFECYQPPPLPFNFTPPPKKKKNNEIVHKECEFWFW